MKCFICQKRLTERTAYECDCGELFCFHCLPSDCGYADEDDEPTYGPQEPPQDYRIFNQQRLDGTYLDLKEFFFRNL